MKSKKKIAIAMCIVLLGVTAILSGCITSVKTVGWNNSEIHPTGVKLKGAAPKEYNGFPLVEVKFVFDDESHENWKDYEITIKGDDIINKKTVRGILYFEALKLGLNLTKVYHFRAVAKYAGMNGEEDPVIQGEEISFSLMQGGSKESTITEEIIKEELLKK